MHENFSNETESDATAIAYPRTCQLDANGLSGRTKHSRNNNTSYTTSCTTSNLHNKTNDSSSSQPQQSHSLRIMPPYRCASSDSSSVTTATSSSLSLLPPLSRRRCFQRQTCFIYIVTAFMLGLLLGVFAPLVDLRNVFVADPQTNQPKTVPLTLIPPAAGAAATSHKYQTANAALTIAKTDLNWLTQEGGENGNAQRMTINRSTTTATTAATANVDVLSDVVPLSPFSVAFINERPAKIGAEEILSDTTANKHSTYTAYKSINKRRDQHVQGIHGGEEPPPHMAVANARASKMLHFQNESPLSNVAFALDKDKELTERRTLQRQTQPQPAMRTPPSIIKGNIYWGELVERALPQGFSATDVREWNAYVASPAAAVQQLQPGCGRMQNRLLIFRDGTRACARYRQNTDQIQGELFSFYLGRLLNMSNLAPSAILTVNVESEKWSQVLRDITQAQWKQQRPVVLTRWLPNLEPAGIPQPFQPIDRHLNKYDVWNITALVNAPHDDDELSSSGGRDGDVDSAHSAAGVSLTPNSLALERLVELAQWSDLIVFDYLIANLDRVVNNLYNYQWNAEIMAAPAHNLARQSQTQLLIFLDNESGLLHGYRLLKKYEAYHGLLLNNLCVFREPTIRALRKLREAGAGRKLRELFEQTTNAEVRDVLPTLPDKSIKILVDRIDRVLGQVDNCNQLMMNAR